MRAARPATSEDVRAQFRARAKSAAIRDLKAAGFSPAQICDQLGVSPQLVSAALASAGHRGRPRSRPPVKRDVTCPCGCGHTFAVDV